jgi:hypothetical protein
MISTWQMPSFDAEHDQFVTFSEVRLLSLGQDPLTLLPPFDPFQTQGSGAAKRLQFGNCGRVPRIGSRYPCAAFHLLGTKYRWRMLCSTRTQRQCTRSDHERVSSQIFVDCIHSHSRIFAQEEPNRQTARGIEKDGGAISREFQPKSRSSAIGCTLVSLLH